MSASDDFIALRCGLVLPAAAVRLAIDLEARGLQLEVEHDDGTGDVLVIGPRERITEDDRQQIRLWRRHLITIVNQLQVLQ